LILADTSVWVDFLRGRASPEALLLRSMLGRDPVIVGDLVLCEILMGVPDEQQAHRVERMMRENPIIELVDDDVAIEAAAHFRRLRAKGITVRKTIDLLIASFCLREDVPLLHRDRDFDAMETHLGLRVLRA
jgi:predicted nucleic acid-binding protein